MEGEVRRRITYTDDQEFMNAVYRCTPAGTSEVAEIVGMTRQSAAARLKQLEERDWVWSKKVGPTRVWIHPRVMKQR